MPVDVHLLRDGDAITLAGRRFQVIHAPGHADGQIIFCAPEDRLMLCGDQVLLRITPNIGFWSSTQPTRSAALPGLAPCTGGLAVDVALPGHHGVITDWQGRIGEFAPPRRAAGGHVMRRGRWRHCVGGQRRRHQLRPLQPARDPLRRGRNVGPSNTWPPPVARTLRKVTSRLSRKMK